jgi:glycosyltransferase involved in cell wall biosynthesis
LKITLVHQYYLMPGQSGGSRFNEMARIWSAAGHEVTVIAGTADYTTGEIPRRYRYRWITKEADGCVTVWRAHVPSSYGHGYGGRMWAFLGFTFSASTAALLAGKADIVIATSPPLVAAIPGWIAAHCHVHRVPWIFEIRDLWPESAITTGVLKRGSVIARALYVLEKWACRSATRVNVLTPAFRDDIVGRGLVPQNKVIYVPNGADLDGFAPGDRDNPVRQEFNWGARFVVLYAGAHGRANAVGQLVDAAELLQDRPDILIACVGDGPERAKLELRARGQGLTNIMFCGAQPKSRMVDFINACDAGAAVLQNNPTFHTVYPNKVFDYMACARPTLLAIDGAARSLICEQAGAGVFAAPEDPAELARAIRYLADHPETCAEMGSRGREWVLANASRSALANRYLEYMRELVTLNS